MGALRTTLVTLAFVVAAVACDEATRAPVPKPESSTLHDRASGLSLRYPPGWDATTRPLTEVVWPPQRFAAATYSLADIEPGSNCTPGPALAALPRDGALLHVFEYTDEPDGPRRQQPFPDRPARFELDPETLLHYECSGRSYAIRFADGGRRFQAQLWFGDHAAEDTKREAVEILDSLRVEPVGRRQAR